MNLAFRKTTELDLDYILAAEQHSDNQPFIIPWSREKHQGAIADPDIAHFIVQTDVHQDTVGFVILAGLLDPNDSIEFRRIVITAKGQGYGKATIQLVKQLVFETYQAHRLWLDVKEHNHRAQALYANAGFVVEGTLRDCLKTTNGYESLILMSILRSEY
ncbi:GNAT family N-acetyltransferase [Oscillatoria sp. FACHB-1407]|uniref:GNAT family N-acetyltransferase n=1 Tax=Oscillatoria sp. FACHB-1407 TaxID=2692847 RepID=UPI0016868473|nr:GNAT family protein [Oscillatoria sp. FACHB-1407]MBD2465044.1 GNAT family N-acetyltransferase [Oscillatoria sp. FACHB-1407]